MTNPDTPDYVPEASAERTATANTSARRLANMMSQVASTLRDDFASGDTYDLAHTD